MLADQSIMQTGLKPHHIQLIESILQGCSQVEHAWIFGSRALGTFKDSSDIDIALQGEALTFNDSAQILEQFDLSSLPFKVDVVITHKISSTALLDHIKQRGVSIF